MSTFKKYMSIIQETNVGATVTPAKGSAVLFLKNDKIFIKFFNENIKEQLPKEYIPYLNDDILLKYFKIFRDIRNNSTYTISDLNYMIGNPYQDKIIKYMDTNDYEFQVDENYLLAIANRVKLLNQIVLAVRHYTLEQSSKKNSPLRKILKKNDEVTPSNNSNPVTKQKEEEGTELNLGTIEFPSNINSSEKSLTEAYLSLTEPLLLKALQKNKNITKK